FVVLLADTHDLPETLAVLYRQLQATTCELSSHMGLASVADDCAHYRQALNEARQALDVAQHLRPANGYCNFSELGVLRLLQGI
ncbi:PucR family transcriptional regulator, partial [Pseudomonas syringae]